MSLRQLHRRAAQPLLGVRKSPDPQGAQMTLIQRAQNVDCASREERRDHLEGGILGRCADQHNPAALHVGKEGVLLGAVESVDFVDEENRPDLLAFPAFPSPSDDLAHIPHTRENCAELLRGVSGDSRENGGEGRLPRPGRTPEDHRGEAARAFEEAILAG
jgi:hypothetical protein